MLRRPLALAAVAVLAVPALAPAAVPSTIPFQSRLVDGSGAPVAAGTVCQFAIFSTETGGTALWGPETHTVTPVNGVVSLFLGDGDTPDPIDESVFAAGDRFLEVTVGGETLAPRIRMSTTGYAFRAESVSDGAITANSIASNAVNGAKVANESLTGADIQNFSITTNDLADGTINFAKLAANAVTGDKVANGSLTDDDLVDEPGVASNFRTTDLNFTTIGTRLNVLSQTINCPSSGFVLATGGVTFALVHNPQFFITRAIASLSTTSATHDTNFQSSVELPSFGANGAGLAGVYRQTVSSTAVFPVNAGNNTIFLVGEIDAGGSGLDHRAVDATLTLAFFPTAYGTVATAAQPAGDARPAEAPATR
jgi:hypothetical protein